MSITPVAGSTRTKSLRGIGIWLKSRALINVI